MLPPNPRPPATIQDIATHCGVAKSTVSRILRGQRGHNPATVRRVLAAAKRLGYRPNPLVTSLMINLRRQNRDLRAAPIAVVDTWTNRPVDVHSQGYYRDIAQTLETQAEKSGFGTELFSLYHLGGDWERLRGVLIARGIRGLVLLPPDRPGTSVPIDLSPFACSTIGYALEDPPLHRASINHYENISIAVQRLRLHGYRRIGLALRRAFDDRSRHLWQAGFHIQQQSIPSRDRLPILWYNGDGAAQVAFWVEKSQPDAVVCLHREVPRWLRAAGIAIPGRLGLALIGTERGDRSLAGIIRSNAEIAEAAMDLVVGQLYRNEVGVPRRPQLILVSGEWMEGASIRSP